jgi:crotonobetainyl-CoA:carnitine CoA-transferase CaiB-like acyl-CoA transferase
VYRAAGAREVLVAIAVSSDEQWEALLDVFGDDELRSAAYASAPGRRAAEESLEARIREAISGRDGPEIVQELLSRGVPASLVVSGEDVMELEALRSSGFVEVFSHRIAGTHEAYVLPFRISAEPRQWIRHAAPTLGQHNEEVLGELLGLDGAAVQCLRESAVIGERPLGA